MGNLMCHNINERLRRYFHDVFVHYGVRHNEAGIDICRDGKVHYLSRNCANFRSIGNYQTGIIDKLPMIAYSLTIQYKYNSDRFARLKTNVRIHMSSQVHTFDCCVSKLTAQLREMEPNRASGDQAVMLLKTAFSTGELTCWDCKSGNYTAPCSVDIYVCEGQTF